MIAYIIYFSVKSPRETTTIPYSIMFSARQRLSQILVIWILGQSKQTSPAQRHVSSKQDLEPQRDPSIEVSSFRLRYLNAIRDTQCRHIRVCVIHLI